MAAPAAVEILRETYAAWSEDKAPRLAAALAFYTVFSLAPLLVIVIEMAALILGAGGAAHNPAVRGAVFHAVAQGVGREGARALDAVVDSTLSHRKQGAIASLIGWGVLLFGAIGFFGTLQDTLNTVWQAPAAKANYLKMVRDRFKSFALVGGIVFLLLASLAISTVLHAFGNMVLTAMPGATAFLHVVNDVMSIAVITGCFAIVYESLPDVHIPWRHVWLGAFVTAVLFVAGEFVLSFYLAHVSISSTYGGAGSLVAVLLWIYYIAQLFIFGAEFTKVYSRRRLSLKAQLDKIST